MSARAYSVRFMSGRGGQRTETYTVPDGRRAVVRSVTVYHWATAGAMSYVFVHGILLLWNQTTSGMQRGFTNELRLTAYAGETIAIRIEGSDVSYGVDGFLYDDSDGRPDDADNVITPITGESVLPSGP